MAVSHLPTGRVHRIRFSGLGGPPPAPAGWLWSGTGAFSPDGRRFVVPTLGVQGSALLLYEIPAEWPASSK